MKTTHTLIIASLYCLTAAQGAALQIDFSADAGTQAGWEGLGGTADATTASGIFSGYTDLAAGNITVSLSGLEFNRLSDNGGATVTDFPGTTLDAMYNDMLFRNDDSQTVNVNISGLLAGTYQITTHHLLSSPNPGDFDLNVQDADSASFGQFVGNFAQGTGNASSFNPNVITFEVVSNGTDDIILQMVQGTPTAGGGTGGWFGYNGMEIDVVPEPSSTALLGLGGLALILRRRR
ncbi:MAG: PEP-CTERM sorting domain-containing protein [Akkermansiaceae bacterium]